MFPTKICESLVKASAIEKLFETPHGYKQPLGQFQRLSMVTDYDMAFKAVAPHLTGKPDEQQVIGFKLIHDITKHDCLSIAMEQLVETVETSRSDREKIAAATVINELYGDKELVKDIKLTDRLMINLVGE